MSLRKYSDEHLLNELNACICTKMPADLFALISHENFDAYAIHNAERTKDFEIIPKISNKSDSKLTTNLSLSLSRARILHNTRKKIVTKHGFSFLVLFKALFCCCVITRANYADFVLFSGKRYN